MVKFKLSLFVLLFKLGLGLAIAFQQDGHVYLSEFDVLVFVKEMLLVSSVLKMLQRF